MIYADEVTGWDKLHAYCGTKRGNHSVAFMDEGICTNQGESSFSRLPRMEIETHHHIAGPYFNAFAGEALWREDDRRAANVAHAPMGCIAAMGSSVSRKSARNRQR